MTDVAAAAAAAEVNPAELDQFVTLGLTGRRNALGDVLDENVTKTSTKTLLEKLHRIQSTDSPDVTGRGGATEDCNASKSSDLSLSQGNPTTEPDKVS